MTDDDPYSRAAKNFRGTLKLRKPKGAVARSDARKKRQKMPTNEEFELCDGRIVSNDSTVQGMETKFMEVFKVGDEIAVNHPTSFDFEERVVTNVVSQRTLMIDSAFSTDLITTCTYFRKKGEEEQIGPEEQKTVKKSLVLRERSGFWSYKTTKHDVEGDLTNEDLLDMRIKRTGRDKFC